MANGTDVKFAKHIKLSLVLLQNLSDGESRFVASVRDVKLKSRSPLLVANHMQDLSMQGCDGGRSAGGGGVICLCILSILFIQVQDKSVKKSKHVGWQALQPS